MMMKLYSNKTDIFISVFWVLVYTAYREYFGDYGPLFYLIHTPPVLFVIPFVIYLLYCIVKRRWPFLPILVACLIFLHLNFFSGRDLTIRTSPNSDAMHTEPVRICSWNTAYFFKWGKEAGLQRVKDQKCDFILFQEVWQSEERYDDILAVRNSYFPEYYFYNYGEFLIFARKEYTISTARSETSGFYSISTKVKGKPLGITSIHLWNPITFMPKKVGNILTLIPAQHARKIQKAELIAYLEKKKVSDETSIIVGDFNTLQNGKIISDISTMDSHRYSFISTPLFKSKNTYSTRLPIIQIDFAYITTKDKENSSLNMICKPNASDHCLLIIDLVL